MGLTYIKPSFSVGELSPSLYGRTDLQAFHRGAATARNVFCDYKGGLSSRAGTAFVGMCLQPGSTLPPVDIPFRVSLTENYVLEFGNYYLRIKVNGGYVTEDSFNLSAATRADPCVITVPGHDFSPNDWIYIDNIVSGMTRLSRGTFIVHAVSGDNVTLYDIFNLPLDSSSYGTYTYGGRAARILTITTPYVSADLDSIKYSQDATVLTLVHRNYPVYDLTRVSANDWTLTQETFGSSIVAPASITVTASATTATNPTAYSYVVTAIDVDTGEESVASPIGGVTNSVNINSLLGTLTIEWAAVTGAVLYNIYKAPISVDGTIPVGVIFGYVGSALGTSFIDTNITADFALSPPLHLNPFAVNSIESITVTAAGSGYTSSPTLTINTTTGSGASLLPVVDSGHTLVAVIVVNGGAGYGGGDTISISGGGGSGAAVSIVRGPSLGTYPSVVSYFQQRRAYASTLNEPDTYFLSKPGAFTNMDAAAITNDGDSIVGAPWAQQVQGIQALIPMPGGLVSFTGLGVWQVSGGSPGAAITPANQAAVPQAYEGCHQHLQPININFDILYVQAMGSIVRDLSYNLYANIYTGTDLSVLSNHLFETYRITSWTWAEEPFKIIWLTRDDGMLLSLTYLKEQEIQGWSRHDTQGLFMWACSIIEQPVNAVYLIVKRLIAGNWYYFSERMNNRLWSTIEDCWCVDAGAALEQTTYNSILTASAVSGDAVIDSIDLLLGGSGYTDPSVRIEDPDGTGAALEATVSGGIITAITILTAGTGYTSPKVIIEDSTGVGAAANASISNTIIISIPNNFPPPVPFNSDDVGRVFRGGGGRGTVTQFISPSILKVNVDTPITAVLQNTPVDQPLVPLPMAEGTWTLTTPTDTVYLPHLKGQYVCGLIDGNQVKDLLVGSDGLVTLPHTASSIVLGLEFVAQIQSMNVEIEGSPTVQGKRKNIQTVTARLKASRGVSYGSNQPNASQQPNQANVLWGGAPYTDMVEIQERTNDVYAGMAIPLFTGDQIINIPGQYGPESKPGQVCAQSSAALPMTLLAFMPDLNEGDNNG